jgi:hypothetical protein
VELFTVVRADFVIIGITSVCFMLLISGIHILLWPFEEAARKRARLSGTVYQNPLPMPARYAIGAATHGLCTTGALFALVDTNPLTVALLYWLTWGPGGVAIIALHWGRKVWRDREAQARQAGALADVLRETRNGTAHRGAADAPR